MSRSRDTCYCDKEIKYLYFWRVTKTFGTFFIFAAVPEISNKPGYFIVFCNRSYHLFYSPSNSWTTIRLLIFFTLKALNLKIIESNIRTLHFPLKSILINLLFYFQGIEDTFI